MYPAELTSRGGGGYAGASGITADTGESLEQVLRERDATLEDNRAVENAFADLHRRYEKLRASTESNKQVLFILLFTLLREIFPCPERGAASRANRRERGQVSAP